MKYFRIHTKDISQNTQQPRGLFVAVWKLVEAKQLTSKDEQTYWENRKWFESNLPLPPFYKDGNPQKAVTWYKDNEFGNSMSFRMSFYYDIARKYSIPIFKSTTEHVPGDIIYEDDYQIAAINQFPDIVIRTGALIW